MEHGGVISGHEDGWGVFAQRADRFLGHCVLLAEGAPEASLLQRRGDDD